MSMWRCPHCGTPQAETARCWVCHRSSTTCSTCRHFRRSVAIQIGYCGLDRRRLPLVGTEHRGCWEGGPARNAGLTPEGDPVVASTPPPDPRHDTERHRDFVPVELARAHAMERVVVHPVITGSGPDAMIDGAPEAARGGPAVQRVTLFRDFDR